MDQHFRRHTRCSGTPRGRPTWVGRPAVLCALMMWIGAGCAQGPRGLLVPGVVTMDQHPQSREIVQDTPPPATLVDKDTTAAKRAAEEELGPDETAAMPVIQEAAVVVVSDPGAMLLVRTMLESMPARIMDADGATRVSVDGIRNQSRCDRAEFEAMSRRLATLLSQAGAADHFGFMCDGPSAAHYQLQGAAYLVTADGFDQWELYLSLTPMNRRLTIWESRGPVRMLRQERAGPPHVIVTRP